MQIRETNIIIYFSPISPKRVKEDLIGKLKSKFNNVFTSDEFNSIIEKESSKLSDNNYFFIGSGGTENQIAALVDKIKYPQKHEQFLLSYESNNSLPAAMEIRSYLANKMKINCKIIHNSFDLWIEKLEKWQNYSNIYKEIQKSVMGVIGTPSYWLIASNVDYNKIKNSWGITIKDISLDELINPLLDNSSQFSKDTQFAKKLIENANSIKVAENEVKLASRVAEQLTNIVKKHNLNAISLECFTLLEKTNITGCYGLSLLNDEGIIAGCEGDIPTTFTMFLANLITQENTSFMVNVSDLNLTNNTVTLAHCTVPISMTESYEVVTHFETNMSVAIKGSFKEDQEITIFKMGNEDLSDWWVSSGKIVKNLTSNSACRTQILVKLNSNVDYFTKSSLANHHIVLLGNHEDKIREFLEFKSQI